MRRIVTAAIVMAIAVGWAGSPAPGTASCARTAALEEVAKESGTAVFTGWAAGRVAGSRDLVFVVDRWFHGGHAAREVRLLGYSAFLEEEEARGPVAVTLAEVVSGDAISLVQDEPVLIVAEWSRVENAFGARACTVSGVPLDSPEGRAALAEAKAAFGRGRAGSELPDTSTLALGPRGGTGVDAAPAEWWLPALALGLAAALVLVFRRFGRPHRASA